MTAIVPFTTDSGLLCVQFNLPNIAPLSIGVYFLNQGVKAMQSKIRDIIVAGISDPWGIFVV